MTLLERTPRPRWVTEVQIVLLRSFVSDILLYVPTCYVVGWLADSESAHWHPGGPSPSPVAYPVESTFGVRGFNLITYYQYSVSL